VKSGSSIMFAGDPMNAALDINAVYNVNASIKNLVAADSSDKAAMALQNRSIPIDLNLLITNTLEKPDINFLISSTDNSFNQNQIITSAIDMINSNKTEVYNQAFGLLLFNSFIPFITGGMGGDQQMQGISNSFTQFFTQQLSNFFTKGLEQIGLKGASLDVLMKDIESKESRQLGFSYKQELFNSRLVFTVGGNVNFGNSPTNVSNINAAAGNNSTFTSDFVLEYLITADGRIRLKTFAKTGEFDIINQDRVRTGGAIAFQKDFDSFKEFFQTRRQEKEKKKEN
jgi:hypothetical protein